MNRMKNIVVQNPILEDVKLPEFRLDTSGLTTPARETQVSIDKWGDFHLLQKHNGQTHVVSFDFEELKGILLAIMQLKKRGNK